MGPVPAQHLVLVESVSEWTGAPAGSWGTGCSAPPGTTHRGVGRGVPTRAAPGLAAPARSCRHVSKGAALGVDISVHSPPGRSSARGEGAPRTPVGSVGAWVGAGARGGKAHRARASSNSWAHASGLGRGLGGAGSHAQITRGGKEGPRRGPSEPGTLRLATGGAGLPPEG